MRAGAKLLGSALVAGALALTGCQGSDQAQRPAQVPVPVKVQPAQDGAIASALSFSGSVQARDQVELVAQSSGRIEKVLVDVGSVVKAGDPIAQIETDTLRVNLKSAEAGLQSAQAKLATTLQGARPEEIAAARATLEAARARYQNMLNGGRTEAIASAEADLAAARARLADVEAGTKPADLAAAQAAVDTATASVASAETRLNQLLNPTPADIQAATAAADSASAAMQSAQARLEQLLHPSLGDIATAEATLESARARLATLKDRPTTSMLAEAQRAVDSAKTALLDAQRRLTGFDNQLMNVTGGPAYRSAWSASNAARTKLEQDLAGNASPLQIQADQLAFEEAWRGVATAEREVVWNSLGFTAADYAAAQNGVVVASQNLKDAQKRLADLDPIPTDDELRAAELAVVSAQTKLAQLKEPAPADLAAAQAAVSQAEAARVAAQNRLETLKNPTPADVQAARSALDSARATLASNQAKLQQAKDGPTAADLQAARSAVQKAEQALATARNPTTELELKAQQQTLVQAENNTALVENRSTAQDIQAATAAVATAEAQLEQARLALAKATLTAPFDAIVAKKYLSEGAMAGGQQPVVSLVSSVTEVVFNVEEASLGRLKEGQSVTLTVPAYGEKPFKGKVTSIAPVADAASRTFTVKALPDENDGQLKAGMFANLSVTVASREKALLVQRAAIVQRPDGPVVFVVRDEKAEMRKVKLGLQSETAAEITEGLTAGEQVVVQGNRTLRGNDAVKVIP